MKHPSADKPELMRWLQMQGDADRRILAQLWALPPESDPASLYRALTDPQRVLQQWERLSDAERAALTRVLQEGGSLPSAILQRTWGPVRDPAHFANPRAYLQALEAPASPAERLYMMGLLVRAHDDRGPIFRVLNDLRALLPAVEPPDTTLQVIPVAGPLNPELASPARAEQTVLILLELAYDGALTTLDDGALNKASLVRVAARLAPGSKLGGVRREVDWPWVALFRAAAVQTGLLRRTTDGLLQVTQQAPGWLQASRAERLAALVRGWTASNLNELTFLCGLSLRSLPFDLRLQESRHTLLGLLASLSADEWLPIKEIISEVRRVAPDFLRRAGRYDSWLIYNAAGQALAGEENWPQVEGVFIQAVLLAVLRWFGLVDAAGSKELDTIRFTPLAAHVIQGAPPPPEPEPEPLAVQGTFEIVCPPAASLWARFQLHRIAELVGDDAAAVFRLTQRSILRAAEHGISADEILRFLTDYGRGPVPQAVATYIHEWAGRHGRLRLEEAMLLRADDPIHLLELRKARGVDLSSVEELTPKDWKVEPGDVPALLQQLQRAGLSVAVDGKKSPGAGPAASKSALSEHDLKALVTAAFAYAHVCAELGIPCEVSTSMLMRLRKLVPSRHAEAARHAAEELRRRLHDREAGGEVISTAAGDDRYA